MAPSRTLVKAFLARPKGGAVSECPDLPGRFARTDMSFGADAADKVTHKNGQWTPAYSATILSISLPVVSQDGRYALVSIGLACGPLCGNGSTLLYRREADGRWNPVGDGAQWIS
ncbi:hypothetical protein [Phenylobacterium sp.]|uniref:hypothetical protein n=1 Tax=Phenylobacterium sp. TaxID=1871053 RepID=UPI002C65F86C|nr:hypothetical protein [Phenylobacterium sp.]HLZ74676.1 hypothetical protein [Phenylobacterium sp.]